METGFENEGEQYRHILMVSEYSARPPMYDTTAKGAEMRTGAISSENSLPNNGIS